MSQNVADGKSIKSCVIYLTKKLHFPLPLKLWLLRGSRTKSARASPQQGIQNASNRFAFGGVIAERVNTAKFPSRVNPTFGGSLASSRITTLKRVFSSNVQNVSNVRNNYAIKVNRCRLRLTMAKRFQVTGQTFQGQPVPRAKRITFLHEHYR